MLSSCNSIIVGCIRPLPCGYAPPSWAWVPWRSVVVTMSVWKQHLLNWDLERNILYSCLHQRIRKHTHTHELLFNSSDSTPNPKLLKTNTDACGNEIFTPSQNRMRRRPKYQNSQKPQCRPNYSDVSDLTTLGCSFTTLKECIEVKFVDGMYHRVATSPVPKTKLSWC